MHKGDKKSISVNHLCQDKDEQHKQDTNVLKYDNIYRKHDKLALFEMHIHSAYILGNNL